MALTLTILADGHDLAFTIPPELAELVGTVDTSKAANDWALGDEIRCDIKDVLAELDRMKTTLKDESTTCYNYKVGMHFMGELPYEESSGGSNGFKIGGVPAGIYSGFEQCDLTFYKVLDDGTTTVLEERDVRDQKEIQTDDWGVLKIIKRKARSQSDRWLTSLIKSVKGIEGEVTVSIA